MTVILGGSFDPVHLGHIYAASVVSKLLGNIKIQLMLASTPRLRNELGASKKHRWEMLTRACGENNILVPSDIELKSRGETRTVCTLQKLTSQYRNINWIIGSDAVEKVSSWYQSKELPKLTNFLVLIRPQHPNVIVPEGFVRVSDVNECLIGAGKIYIASDQMLEISASQIRERISAREDFEHLVPESVLTYIMQHELYQ